MPDAGQTGGVQFPILRGPVVDLLIDCQFRGGKSDQRARFVDQFAIRLTVGIATDLATLRRFGCFVDVPPCERGGIENVLVSSADENDWIVPGDRVKITPPWETLLFKLRFVPIAVGDHDVAGSCGLYATAYCSQDVCDRARVR